MTCPCCRGTGKTRRVSGPKSNGTDSWYIQEAPCMFCQRVERWEWVNVEWLAIKEPPKPAQQSLI